MKKGRARTKEARFQAGGFWGKRAAVLLLLGLLWGCGGNGKGDSITIQFWQFWPSETIRPLLEQFERENPDIRVQMQQLTWQSGLEKITAAVAAGRPPDLCELGSTWFAKFASEGTLTDLTSQTNDLRSSFLMWDACMFHDRVYGLPWVTGTRALFVNRKLMKESGLNPNHLPETWADLLALAHTVHNPREQIYGYGLNTGERYVQFKKFMPFAWGNGGRVLTPMGTRCAFSDTPVVEALEFYLKLKPYSLMEKQEVLDQAFREGKLGAMISGAWLLKSIPREAPDLDFGVALVPRPGPNRGTHASFGGGEILVVFQRSARKEAALKLARFLIAAKQAMAVSRAEQSVLPAAREAERDPYFRDNPRQAVFLEQLQTAVFPPNVRDWVEIEDVVDSALERAVFERAKPRAALDDACRRIDEILARHAH